MVQFDISSPPIYFLRFYRGDPDQTTQRFPVFDLDEIKAMLKEELRDRVENHIGRGKAPSMADIIDENGNQLLVVRYVSPDRIDAFELNATKTAVKRVKD